MYINSEDEALFLEFIGKSGLAPASIKNIKSDVSHIFKWLHSLNLKMDTSTLAKEYERYLIFTKQNESSVKRRLMSLGKFTEWYASQHTSSKVSSRDLPSSHSTNSKYESQNEPKVRFPTYFFILFICSLLGLSFYSIPRLLNNMSHAGKGAGFNADATPYFMAFDLVFNNEIDLKEVSKDPLLFNFYGDSSDGSYIGNTICYIPPRQTVDGQSRLKINLGLDCGIIPEKVIDYLGSNNNVFVDILSNNVHLISSKISIADQSYAFDKLINQNNSKYVQGDIGSSSENLPNMAVETITPKKLDNNSASNANSVQGTISLNNIASDTSFSDGDIIGLYNGEFDRALLSTKVIGVVSGDAIQTSGIVEVNVIRGSEVIIPGDLISTSLEPGYGQKAVLDSDNIFGVAIEQYATNSGKLRVLLDI